MHSDVQAIIDEIVAISRYRKRAMKLRIGAVLAIQSLIREELGWSRDLPEEQRDEFTARAARAIEAGRKYHGALTRWQTRSDKLSAKLAERVSRHSARSEAARQRGSEIAPLRVDASIYASLLPPAKPEDPDFLAYERLILVCWDGVLPQLEAEKRYEQQLDRLGEKLPVFPWWRDNVAKNGASLARIIGEIGDPSVYTVRQQRRRMGLANFDGHAGSTWMRTSWRPRALTKDEWTALGYVGARVAMMFMLSSSLIMNHTKRPTRYRAVFDARRAHTAVTHPDWTPMHSQRDAYRIVGQQILSDLWSEWRRPSVAVNARDGLAAADPIESSSGPEPDAHRPNDPLIAIVEVADAQNSSPQGDAGEPRRGLGARLVVAARDNSSSGDESERQGPKGFVTARRNLAPAELASSQEDGEPAQGDGASLDQSGRLPTILQPGDLVQVDYDDSTGEPVCTGQRIIRASGEIVEVRLA